MSLSISGILAGALQFYSLIVFIYVLMSWFRPTGALWEIYHAIGMICEPYLGLFRRIVPVAGGVDFSPMIALIVLQFVGGYVVRLLAASGL